jgi:hypothetical protein
MEKVNMSTETSNQGLHPPKINIQGQYLGSKPSGKQWMYEYDHASGSVRRSAQTNSLSEGYESSTESSRPSYPRSLTSSMGQTFIEASDSRPSSLANHEIIRPSGPAKELAIPSLLLRNSQTSKEDKTRSSEESSSHLSTNEHVISFPPPVHHTRPEGGLATVEATVDPATDEAIDDRVTNEAIDTQRFTERYRTRCKRNITLQKFAVTAGLVTVKYVNKLDSTDWVEKHTYKAQFYVNFCVLVVGEVLLCLLAIHLPPFGTQLYNDCINRSL